jgi:GAF domain-containing protein
MILAGDERGTPKNTLPVPLHPPQLPYGLTWVQTRTSAVTDWRLMLICANADQMSRIIDLSESLQQAACCVLLKEFQGAVRTGVPSTQCVLCTSAL